LNIGKYQAIVAGVALVLTTVQNPDGITGTATGKGPAAALETLTGRVTAKYRQRLAGRVKSHATVNSADSSWPAVAGGIEGIRRRFGG
jgi:hypothetical protein